MSLSRKIIRFKSDRTTENLPVVLNNPAGYAKQRIRLFYIFNNHPSQIIRNFFYFTQQRAHPKVSPVCHTLDLILGFLRQCFR